MEFMIKLDLDCYIIKTFNNNIVLVERENTEQILFSKGIGFNKREGQVVSKGTLIEKVFVIEDTKNISNFRKIIERNNKDFVAFCEGLIFDLSNDLKEQLSENIHIGLIDHISFAIRRLKNEEIIENPFLVEIETLYPLEFNLAQRMGIKISEFINLDIPDGEIAFIALHIHSARNNEKLSNTIKYAYISNSIIECVEDMLDIEINKKSLDYARFITHIRFAIERIMTKTPIKNDLLGVIKNKYVKSYEIAIEVAKLLEEELEIKVVEDEIAYIAMHIERFRVSLA